MFDCGDCPNMLSALLSQTGIGKLQNWFELNKLSLIVGETIFLIFGEKRTIPNVTININHKTRKSGPNHIQGVIVDDKLTGKYTFN